MVYYVGLNEELPHDWKELYKHGLCHLCIQTHIHIFPFALLKYVRYGCADRTGIVHSNVNSHTIHEHAYKQTLSVGFVIEVLGVKCTENFSNQKSKFVGVFVNTKVFSVAMFEMLDLLFTLKGQHFLYSYRFRLNRSCSEFCKFHGIWLWNGAISLLQGHYAWRNLGLSVLLKGTVVMADADWPKNLTVTISEP